MKETKESAHQIALLHNISRNVPLYKKGGDFLTVQIPPRPPL